MAKIVGILNVTHNSFSDGGEYLDLDSSFAQYQKLKLDGADIVDIGAISTAYGADLLDADLEKKRLEPLLNKIKKEYGDLSFISIDTFRPEIAEFCINLGVRMINDVSGGVDHKMLDVISKNSHVLYVCMCSLEVPANKERRIESLEKLYEYAIFITERAIARNVAREQIILDPGIGFVSGPELSIEVIKNIKLFKKIGLPLYVGHSRKSFLVGAKSAKYAYMKKDPETLAASLYMLINGVDYLRVHNVEMHVNAIKVFSELTSVI